MKWHIDEMTRNHFEAGGKILEGLNSSKNVFNPFRRKRKKSQPSKI
jgi:hypothetical protein